MHWLGNVRVRVCTLLLLYYLELKACPPTSSLRAFLPCGCLHGASEVLGWGACVAGKWVSGVWLDQDTSRSFAPITRRYTWGAHLGQSGYTSFLGHSGNLYTTPAVEGSLVGDTPHGVVGDAAR